MNIEELVALKLLEFINYDPADREMDEIGAGGGGGAATVEAADHYHGNRNVTSMLARSTQYYFANLLVELSKVRLSVFTSAERISRHLSELKKKAGLRLIRFEEALIQLRPFQKIYSLMTKRFLFDSIREHYMSELRSQAAKILGTVDFLGNPVGFLNNLADGINELVFEGNVSGLILNLTHGISDSTAKVTSALGESLGVVTMDARHEEIRRKIKQRTTLNGGQRGHLSAATLGLLHGMVGGFTSVITQTYEGVSQGGLTGLFSGFGKGMLGTITKPAVGMLDFASGAATAVRNQSRKLNSTLKAGTAGAQRVRLPRTLTIDGRITTYDPVQATWQARLYNTNAFGGHREPGEQFVHVFALSERHFMLLTTERLYFFHCALNLTSMAGDNSGTLSTSADDELDEVETRNARIMRTPISQLQLLSLDEFGGAGHARMKFSDAVTFLRGGSNPNGEEACLGPIYSKLAAGDQDVSLIELSRKPKTSTPTSPRPSVAMPIATVKGIECVPHLSLCYTFCSSSQTADKLVQLVNEAMHLLEERKFKVPNANE